MYLGLLESLRHKLQGLMHNCPSSHLMEVSLPSDSASPHCNAWHARTA